MKRIAVLVAAGALASFAVLFALRHAHKSSSDEVAALLPKETLGFVHVPNLNRARDQWHETDLYQIWKEPAVQQFLQKPMANAAKANSAHERLSELEALEPKNIFTALTEWEKDAPKIVGGFQFKGSAQDAEKVIGKWRGAQNLQHETIAYQQHQIDVGKAGNFVIATVYDGNWFLAANNLDLMKATLDRVDGRAKDREATLAANEKFKTATRHALPDFAALAYARMDKYFDFIFARMSSQQVQIPPAQIELAKKMGGFSATFGFDKGKMRESIFVQMPEPPEMAKLARTSLAATSADTFLYLATVLNLSQQQAVWPAAMNANDPFSNRIASVMSMLSAKGITMEKWRAAFSDEAAIDADWNEHARQPAAFLILPVKNSAEAKALVRSLASGWENVKWTEEQEGSVTYFSMETSAGSILLTPTIALSERFLIAGLNRAAVSEAMARTAAGKSTVAETNSYRAAASALPEPKQSFFYLDAAMLYTRLDAAFRPALMLMSAFMPNLNETIDVSKLPPAETIARHLSPIVMTQSYEGDGYLLQSIGPVTFYEAIAGGAAAFGAGWATYHRATSGWPGVKPRGLQRKSPPRSVSPSPSPDEE